MTSFLRDPRRLARAAGVAVILALWGVCGGFAVAGAAAYCVYADLKAPTTSFLTRGTPAEPIARTIYLRHFRRIWHTLPNCVEFDPRLVYIPRPVTVRYTGAEFDTTIRVTPRRVRQQPPARAGAPFVVVTGDSYTFGWGVEDNETYASILQRDYGYHTVNTGVPGYGAPRELLRLRRLGLLNHIDALIIEFCDKDAGENRAFLADPAHYPTPTEARRQWDELMATGYQDVTYLNVAADLARYMRIELRSRGLVRGWREIREERTPPFGTLLRQHKPRGEQMAADFLAVLDQFPELKGRPILVTEMVPNNGYTGFTDALRRLAQDRPNIVPVTVNYRPGDYFRFDLHLTASGHRAAAAALAAALRQSIEPDKTTDASAYHPGY